MRATRLYGCVFGDTNRVPIVKNRHTVTDTLNECSRTAGMRALSRGKTVNSVLIKKITGRIVTFVFNAIVFSSLSLSLSCAYHKTEQLADVGGRNENTQEYGLYIHNIYLYTYI